VTILDPPVCLFLCAINAPFFDSQEDKILGKKFWYVSYST
jgi:hypothetical protein